VIIVSYNNLELMQRTLASILEKTEYPNYEVIVVDNGSGPEVTDYLEEMAAEYPDQIKVVLNGRNVGFAAANNIGITMATASEYIVLLNNDVIVTRAWLTTLIGHLADEQIGLVGPVTNSCGNEARIDVDYADISGIDAFAARYTSAHASQIFDIGVLAMYCVALRRAVVDEIGPLDEIFGVGMFEDDDYALRIREAGYRVVCAEDVFIHHFGRASFAKMEDEAYKQLFEENKRLFEQKWNRPWVPHHYRPQKEMGLPSRALVGTRSSR
jgi:GT2 family glycosyltransferase